MFEISDLKSKKLPELQEIAKGLNVPKYKTQKKLDLVYQILDVQAANPKAVAEVAAPKTEDAPKPKPRPRPRKRVEKEIKNEVAPTAVAPPTPASTKDAQIGRASCRERVLRLV